MSFRILVINPGSTSTKLAVFDGETQSIRTTLRHSEADLSKFSSIVSQHEYREAMVLNFLSENKIALNSINAIVGRGGLLEPLEGGTYEVNDKMYDFLKSAKRGEHASNLGALIAKSIADKIHVDAFIVDPVVVDEMDEIARYSGHPLLERISIFHALNQKAVGRKIAEKLGKTYNECNFVIAHVGGGISVASHRKGRVVDVNNALDGEGAFSPERSGTLPVGKLVELCFSGRHDKSEIKSMIKGRGGVVAYLGTNNIFDVEKRIEEGDKKAKLVFDAMCYQIAKEIGAYSVVLSGNIDRIILTGGVANDKNLVEKITSMVSFIAPVEVFPGEEEMQPLALGVLRVLKGEEKAKKY